MSFARLLHAVFRIKKEKDVSYSEKEVKVKTGGKEKDVCCSEGR